MNKRLLLLILLITVTFTGAFAQWDDSTLNGFGEEEATFNPNRANDTLKTKHKEVPKGMYVWTVDQRFGDIIPQERDSSMHLFMNSGFTSGKYGEYNHTGNLGSPRINRIATDRTLQPTFEFTEPYSFFLTQPGELRFTNTLSPITNLSYYSCGDKTDGEDHLKALFATNINKQAGIGMKFDYIYGRGYYQNQSIALFDYTLWGSYIGERYNAHLIFSFDHMKNTENGGITDDEYVTHPEAQSQTFNTNEIPTQLSDNWNRNNSFHAFLTHRYSIGFNRKVPMTQQEIDAKKAALKAKQDKERAEAERKKEAEGKKQETGKRNFAGRPDDAKVVGELTIDSLNQIKKMVSEENRQVVDSLKAASAMAKEDTVWEKDEYVPVTSFIHTLQLDKYERIYTAYRSQKDFYLNRYSVPFEGCTGDSIQDKTDFFRLRNTLAIGMLEGFNKYVPMGAKVYISHVIKRYTLPMADNIVAANTGYLSGFRSYTENDIYAGAQLIKSTGNLLHYNATGELCLVGENVGDVMIDGTGDLNVKLSARDSVSLDLKAFWHLTNPTTFMRRYASKFFAWDNSFDKQMHTHLEASLSLPRTKTSLRFAYDNIQNYIYLATSYNNKDGVITGYTAAPRQTSKNISLITAMLEQNFALGPLKWENRLTFQQSTDNDILPVPALNVWTNLYLDFKIARVLSVHFGADARYFTKYNAPEYCPQLGQFAVQENASVRTEIGNYPVCDVYANFFLKRCRFFIMYSHVNHGGGNRNYFYTPHYPLNERVMRFGLSWDFFN